jgi:hypothetical protein
LAELFNYRLRVEAGMNYTQMNDNSWTIGLVSSENYSITAIRGLVGSYRNYHLPASVRGRPRKEKTDITQIALSELKKQ